jgi:hypothetical protein
MQRCAKARSLGPRIRRASDFGTVMERQSKNVNMPTGEIEILVPRS